MKIELNKQELKILRQIVFEKMDYIYDDDKAIEVATILDKIEEKL
jgi:hypothetical protein